MILIIASAFVFLVTILFQQNQYVPFYDFASLLCTQLWIFEANQKIPFSHQLFLTTIIMFAQGFVLSTIFLNEDVGSDFSNIYQALIYLILSIVLANPITIRIQHRIAQKYEVYPYAIMVIDRVGQALTIFRYYEIKLFQLKESVSLQSLLATGFLSQISIIVLVFGLRETYSLSQAFSKVQDLALENFLIYTITTLIIGQIFEAFPFQNNLQLLSMTTIFIFVLLTTVSYVSKKYYKKKIVEKEKMN